MKKGQQESTRVLTSVFQVHKERGKKVGAGSAGQRGRGGLGGDRCEESLSWISFHACPRKNPSVVDTHTA